MDENESFFQERLNSADRERRGLNVRVEPDGVMRQGPSLLSVDNEDVLAPWHSLLLCSPPSFYCIDWGQYKCILFHVSCRGMSLFLPLHGQGSVRHLVIPATMAGMYTTASDLHGRLDVLVPFELFFRSCHSV